MLFGPASRQPFSGATHRQALAVEPDKMERLPGGFCLLLDTIGTQFEWARSREFLGFFRQFRLQSFNGPIVALGTLLGQIFNSARFFVDSYSSSGFRLLKHDGAPVGSQHTIVI